VVLEDAIEQVLVPVPDLLELEELLERVVEPGEEPQATTPPARDGAARPA
jgi:hypothetical protein